MDTLSKKLTSEINSIKENCLYKNERIIHSKQSSEILVDNKSVLNFCANNYLGLSSSAELINAAKNGLRISEEKVTVLYNVGSKTSTKNPIIHGTEVASSLIEQILIRNPFRYLGLPGIIFIILGIITSAYLITTFNETRYFSIPFTLLSSSFLIFGTMLLLFSGVLFSVNRAKKS